MHRSILISISLLVIIMLMPQFDCVKVGDCPSYSDSLIQPTVCANLCNGDESCPGTQKCVII